MVTYNINTLLVFLTQAYKISISLLLYSTDIETRLKELPQINRRANRFFLFFCFFTLFYNTVLVLPYIDMNPPWVYTSSQSWIPLPPPTPYHLSGYNPTHSEETELTVLTGASLVPNPWSSCYTEDTASVYTIIICWLEIGALLDTCIIWLKK